MLFKISKLVAVALCVFFCVAGLTIIWFVRLVKMFQARTGAMNVAVDINLITHSPLYWLIVVLILAVAVVICRRWVFV